MNLNILNISFCNSVGVIIHSAQSSIRILRFIYTYLVVCGYTKAYLTVLVVQHKYELFRSLSEKQCAT